MANPIRIAKWKSAALHFVAQTVQLAQRELAPDPKTVDWHATRFNQKHDNLPEQQIPC
jgi:hypothetical protein